MKAPKRPRPSPTAAFDAALATLDRAPIVIRGSRTKAVLLLSACLFFAALGCYAIVRGAEDGLDAGIPAAGIFGLGVLVAAIHVARPSVMTIGPEDVTVQTILRTWSVRFDQVDTFFVYRTRIMGPTSGLSGVEMTAFKWNAGESPAHRPLKLGRLLGADGGFGPGWPLSAKQLADLLNAARAQAVDEAPVPSP